MRNLKKVLSLALALVMLVGMMVIGAGATSYKDDADITHKEAVEVMSALKILEGDKGSFGPNGTLTRGQAAKIIAYLSLGPTAQNLRATDDTFTDVKPSRYYAPFVAYCYQMGIVEGVSATKFNPDGEVTGYQFAKMVLVAMGKDADESGYNGSGSSWRTAVAKDLRELNMSSVTNKPITRDAAAQLAFEGLTKSLNGDVVYVVKSGSDVVKRTTDAMEAALLKSLLDYTVELDNSTNTLGAENYGLIPTAKTDAFGRTASIWAANGGVEVARGTHNEPVQTYYGAVKASDVYKDLGLTSSVTVGGADNANTFYVNGANYRLTEPTTAAEKAIPHPDQKVDTADHNKAVKYDHHTIVLSSDNSQQIGDDATTTEVYYDGTNVKIVSYNTRPAQVKSVDADNGQVTLTVFGIGDKTFKTTELQKDQYVLVTMTNLSDGCDTCRAANQVIQSATPATVIENAKVTAYTANSVTANGTLYQYSASIPDEGGHTKPGTDGKENYQMSTKTYTLVLNQNNRVCAVKDYTAPGAAAPTNFALVLNAAAAMTPGTLNTAASTTLQVRAILGDGTVGVFNVAIGADKKAGGVTIINEEGTDLESGWKTGLEGKVYGYSIDGGVMTLTALDAASALGNNKVVSDNLAGYNGTNAATFDTDKTALFTSNTVFVIYSGTGADTQLVKLATGTANLGTVSGMTGKMVVTGTSTAKVGTVNVVFTQTTPDAASSGSYVYVKYEETPGKILVNGVEKTAYEGKAPDGTTVNVYADAALADSAASGVYTYDVNNKLGSKLVGTKTGIANVVGNLIYVEDDYYEMTDATKTVHVGNTSGDVKSSDTVTIVRSSSGKVETIFITARPS